MRIAKSDEIDNFLQNANLDVLEYYKNRYRIRVDHETLNDSKEQLKGLFLLVEEKFNEWYYNLNKRIYKGYTYVV